MLLCPVEEGWLALRGWLRLPAAGAELNMVRARQLRIGCLTERAAVIRLQILRMEVQVMERAKRRSRSLTP